MQSSLPLSLPDENGRFFDAVTPQPHMAGPRLVNLLPAVVIQPSVCCCDVVLASIIVSLSTALRGLRHGALRCVMSLCGISEWACRPRLQASAARRNNATIILIVVSRVCCKPATEFSLSDWEEEEEFTRLFQ
jgi:hypothetical protein